MKKHIILLTALIMLMSGCNNTHPVQESTEASPTETTTAVQTDLSANQTSSSTNTTTYETEETAQTTISTTSVTDSAPDEETAGIKPLIIDDKIQAELSYEVDVEKLKETIGYDIDDAIDRFLYGDEIGRYTQYIEKMKSELSEEELAEFEKRHYLSELSIDLCYLGLPEADWIAAANYGTGYSLGSFYTRLFYIKNGEIVRELTPFDGWFYGFTYNSGELFVNICSGGLHKLDFISGELQQLISDVWGAVIYIDEDYIVFGSNMQQLLVRETGEVVDTGINWCGLEPANTLRVVDNRIEYYWNAPDGKKFSYDIDTRTLTEDDSLDFTSYTINEYRKAKYKVTQLGKPSAVSNSSHDKNVIAIEVTDNESGETKIYDLSDVADHLHYYDFHVDGDWLWINDRYALNLITDEIAEISLSEDYDTMYLEKGFVILYEDEYAISEYRRYYKVTLTYPH